MARIPTSKLSRKAATELSKAPSASASYLRKEQAAEAHARNPLLQREVARLHNGSQRLKIAANRNLDIRKDESQRQRLARGSNLLGLAQGDKIGLSADAKGLDTEEGRSLLVHELAHSFQQEHLHSSDQCPQAKPINSRIHFLKGLPEGVNEPLSKVLNKDLTQESDVSRFIKDARRKRVDLVGHASAEGAEIDNEELAATRALYVALRVSKTAQSIGTSSEGEKGQEREDPYARRVDTTISDTDASKQFDCDLSDRYPHIAKQLEPEILEKANDAFQSVPSEEQSVVFPVPYFSVLEPEAKERFLNARDLLDPEQALFRYIRDKEILPRKGSIFAQVSSCDLKLMIKFRPKDLDTDNNGFLSIDEIKKDYKRLPNEVRRTVELGTQLDTAIASITLPKDFDIDFALTHIVNGSRFAKQDSILRLAILLVMRDDPQKASKLISEYNKGRIKWVSKFTEEGGTSEAQADEEYGIELNGNAFPEHTPESSIQSLSGTLVHEYEHVYQDVANYKKGYYEYYDIGFHDPIEYPAYFKEFLFLRTRWSRLAYEYKFETDANRKTRFRKLIKQLQRRLEEQRTKIITGDPPVLDTSEPKGKDYAKLLFKFMKDFI